MKRKRTGHPCCACASNGLCTAMHPEGGTMEGHDCATFIQSPLESTRNANRGETETRKVLAALVAAVERVQDAEFHNGGREDHATYEAHEALLAIMRVARTALDSHTKNSAEAGTTTEVGK